MVESPLRPCLFITMIRGTRWKYGTSEGKEEKTYYNQQNMNEGSSHRSARRNSKQTANTSAVLGPNHRGQQG